ncbi:MAG: hypothetical protein ACLT1K_00560 [[Clostridium] leptum]
MAAGAPENCIQWIETPSIEATGALMNHSGRCRSFWPPAAAGMVKAAYSTGKPALGVGPGNVPCYIEKSANLERACTDLMLSKTFDNGMICASEQAVIVDECLADDFERIMKENNCYFLNKEETKKVSDYVINPQKQAVNSAVVGKPATWIAEQAGVKVPGQDQDPDRPSAGSSALSIRSPEKSFLLCWPTFSRKSIGSRALNTLSKMLNLGGLGHSAVIHSTNNDLITAIW